MFKRRIPLTRLQLLREIFWPSMGWGRACKYVHHRIVRLSDSTHRVAAGLATGGAISFSPLLGMHFVQAGGIAYLFRFNLIASLIGTFFGNPWTFPFIWWAALSFGSFILSIFGLPASASLPDDMSMSVLFDLILNEPLRIFLPWMIGGTLIGILIWPIFYVMCYMLVRAAKVARRKARLRNMHKVAREVTGQKK